jgi:hypothetical protein
MASTPTFLHQVNALYHLRQPKITQPVNKTG